MILVLLLIGAGIGFEIGSDKEPVQLHQQERMYEKDHDHCGNKGR